MKTERRKFKMHDALLTSVIRDQAGSLWKGVLEGIQNAVDAGSTAIDLTVTPEKIIISDNGRGFASLQEVNDYFETFGTPHEEGDAIFGHFRMGRGQMFNYGITTYRTGEFRFVVDIEKDGLEYDMHQGLEKHPGCEVTIDLYESLLEGERFDLEKRLRQAIKYLDTPVSLNGEVITTAPDSVKWDYEDDDAYYKLDSTLTVTIYHLGCYILDYPAHNLGSGGTVVAKKHLMVNMARNAINDQCPIWRRIKKFYQDKSKEKNLRKPRLDDAGRQNLIDRLVGREVMISEIDKLKLIRNSNGAYLSLRQVLGRSDKPVAFAPLGHRGADRAMASGMVTVIDEAVLADFMAVSPQEWAGLMERLIRHDPQCWFQPPQIMPLDDIESAFQGFFDIIPQKDWKPVERVWMKALELADRDACGWDAGIGHGHHFPDGHVAPRRKFVLGDSDLSDAWTDGETYIAISRDFLAGLKNRDFADCVRLAQLTMHEYCHRESSAGESHLHDAAFYQNYHDMHETVANLANKLLAKLPQVSVQRCKSTTSALRRVLDRQKVVARAIEDLDEQAGKLYRENLRLDALIEERKASKATLTAIQRNNRKLAKAAG